MNADAEQLESYGDNDSIENSPSLIHADDVNSRVIL